MYGIPGGTFLLITYHLLLTLYYLSLITYYLLLITYYLLLITYRIMYNPSLGPVVNILAIFSNANILKKIRE